MSGRKVNNVASINGCYTTPVVDAISAAHIFVDPAVWSKIIIHPGNKKPNWLGIHLFAKILYWYTRTEVRDEVSGKFLGFKKKFKYHMLQLSYHSICEQMGCTYQEARDALKSLLVANLVINPKSTVNGLGNVMFIEPIPENILCIINPKGVDNEPLCVPTHRGSVSPGTEGLCPRAQSLHILPTCTNTLTSTYDSKGDSSVDNPGGLPTSEPPTNKNFIKEKENVRKLKSMLSKCYQKPNNQPRSKT